MSRAERGDRRGRTHRDKDGRDHVQAAARTVAAQRVAVDAGDRPLTGRVRSCRVRS